MLAPLNHIRRSACDHPLRFLRASVTDSPRGVAWLMGALWSASTGPWKLANAAPLGGLAYRASSDKTEGVFGRGLVPKRSGVL